MTYYYIVYTTVLNLCETVQWGAYAVGKFSKNYVKNSKNTCTLKYADQKKSNSAYISILDIWGGPNTTPVAPTVKDFEVKEIPLKD